MIIIMMKYHETIKRFWFWRVGEYFQSLRKPTRILLGSLRRNLGSSSGLATFAASQSQWKVVVAPTFHGEAWSISNKKSWIRLPQRPWTGFYPYPEISKISRNVELEFMFNVVEGCWMVLDSGSISTDSFLHNCWSYFETWDTFLRQIFVQMWASSSNW